MIETQHIRLSQAALLLGVDEDTLLIAAYEGSLRIFGLPQQPIHAEKIRYDWPEDPEGWPERTVLQSGRCWLEFVAIDSGSLRRCLVGNSATAARSQLTEPDAEGAFWSALDTESDEALTIPRGSLFARRKDVQDIVDGKATTERCATSRGPSILGHSFQSNSLSWLLQAARHHWSNADPDDPSTHPENSVVSLWLRKKGMSKSLADKGASIIRPDWAHVGRKPET